MARTRENQQPFSLEELFDRTIAHDSDISDELSAELELLTEGYYASMGIVFNDAFGPPESYDEMEV